MSCDLEITDCFGHQVTLDHSNWVRHAIQRPEVVRYHDELAMVLRDPDVVIESLRDGHFHFYRRGAAVGRHTNLYLKVVVANYGGIFKMATAWITGAVRPRERAIWRKPASSS